MRILFKHIAHIYFLFTKVIELQILMIETMRGPMSQRNRAKRELYTAEGTTRGMLLQVKSWEESLRLTEETWGK